MEKPSEPGGPAPDRPLPATDREAELCLPAGSGDAFAEAASAGADGGSAALAPAPTGAEMEPAGVYRTRRQASERGLVVLAMGLPYGIVPAESGFQLFVPAGRLADVRAQLALYERESIGWPPRPPTLRERPAGAAVLAHSGLLLILAFVIQRHPGAARIEGVGMMDSIGLFARGEWWRPATALTLHADIGHLAGNLGFGLLFGLFVNNALGPALAGAAVIACGVLGNLLTGWIYYPAPHLSLGASTAVFGAMGLLVGHAVRVSLQEHRTSALKRLFLPFVGGMFLLGYFGGAGDPRIDILAHLCGFAVGLPLGLAASWAVHADRHAERVERWSRRALTLAVAGLAAAWTAAVFHLP